MTHNLHRIGTIKNLQNDYTVIIKTEQGYNSDGVSKKLKIALEIINKNNAVNICGARGTNYKGNILDTNLETIIEAMSDSSTVSAAFNSKKDIIGFLNDMINANLGLSVVIQGLYDNILECCNEVGLKPHTTNHSLGIWGKKELLPSKKILEITTMCGHGMVTKKLVDKQIKLIKEGKISINKAAKTIAKPCICGIVNPKRVELLLSDLIN